MRSTVMIWGLLGLAGAACGDPTVDDRFRGEPLARFAGEVQDRFPLVPIRPPNLRAAVFWDLDGVAGDGQRVVEDASAGLPLPTVPEGFVLNVFDPPPAAAVIDGVYALGRFEAYSDVDLDGRRGPDEPLVGGDRDSALLYAAAALSPEVSPTGNPLAAGFYRVRLPMLCAPAAAGSDPEDCGVALGVRCLPEQTCPGRASCVNDVDMPPWFPSVCVLAEPSADGCRPAGGALIPTRSGRRLFWGKACRDDADCDPELRCDPGVRACVALDQLTLAIVNDVARLPVPPAYCATARP